MEIRILTEDEKRNLAPIYKSEFDSSLPATKAAHIIGVFDGEKLIGHLMVELVARVGLIYVEKDFRGKNVARELLTFLAQNIPTQYQVMVIASEKRFEKICERFGMQALEGKVFVANLE